MRPGASSRALTVILLGEAGRTDLTALEAQLDVETVEAPVAPDAALQESRLILNPLVDEARADWIFFVRSGERVSVALASEIVAAIAAPSRAWGFRVPVRAVYAGRPLQRQLGDTAGEIRLFHRRHARLVEDPGGREMKVQGSVVRLRAELERVLYESVAEHLAALMESGRPPRRLVAHLIRFLPRLLRGGAPSRASIAYEWLESKYDDRVTTSRTRG